MDSNTIRTIRIYFLGALFGAAAGLLVSKLIVEEIPEDDWDYEYEYGNNPEEKVEEPPVAEKLPKKRKAKTNEFKDYTKPFKGNNKGNKVDLAELAKERLGEEAIEETEKENDQIWVITLEDYASFGSDDTKEKICLTYYEEDDTLVDEDDNVVTNPESLIGNCLLKFGEKSQDVDTVYVRNTAINKDYEVVRLHKSYTEAVLGVPPKPKKPRNRRKVKPDVEEDE